MEMSHQSGVEAESLLRPDQRSAVVMPGQRRWDESGEKAPFLRNEPVKLTPAWEGTNLPNDTLNLKGVGMDLEPPVDRWNLVYITLVLHGLGTLTAWNMFITATDYFTNYKLVGTSYKDNYLVYVGWASQVPNLMFSWFNIFVNISGKLSTRIVCSLIVEVIIFVVTIALAMADTSTFPELFFWTTMATVFLLNGFNAIFQNSVFGVAAQLPARYTGAVVLGSNVCGTLVALLNMTSGAAGSLRTSAIYYFIGGMAVLLVCLDTYFALPLNRFFRYHQALQKRSAPSAAAPAPPTPWRSIFSSAALQLYNIFMIFFVSLSVFPAVMASVVSSDKNFFLSGRNFMDVTCFLTFNLTAMIGNITASWFQFPGPRLLGVFTTLRLLFIPFFLLCNCYGDPAAGAARTLPVLVASDWLYWAAGALLGWSSGHGSSLAMMYVCGTVDPELAPKAGMIGGATIITGIFSGITFSGLCPIIVRMAYWKGM